MSLKDQKTGLDSIVSNGSPPSPTFTSTTPANAWSRPLQQKGQKPPPGIEESFGEEAKSPTKSLSRSGSSSVSSQTVLRERFLHLCLALVGQKVVVTQTNGAELEGVFHTSTPFASLPADMKNRFVLKACRTLKQPSNSSLLHAIDGGAAILLAENVLCIHAKNINLDRATNGGFSTFSSSIGPKNKTDILRTDTEISGGKGVRNRDLVAAGSAWTAPGPGGKSRMEALFVDEKGIHQQRKVFGNSAGSNGGLRGSIGEWDQFKANQELFNVSASFDENLYTTELDKSRMDAKKIAEAERIAREIESTSSSNIHVAEERGHVVQGDYDEEDRYSGVLNSDGTARHEKLAGAGTGSLEKVSQSALENSYEEAKVNIMQAPKKMNYAAAAARQPDTGMKLVPPGFSSNGEPQAKEPEERIFELYSSDRNAESGDAVDGDHIDSCFVTGTSKSEKACTKLVTGHESSSVPEKLKSEILDDKPTMGQCKTSSPAAPETKEGRVSGNPALRTSKLNAKAKSFTPVFALSAASSATSDVLTQQQSSDPSAAMHIPPGSHAIQTPHYVHQGHMGQPGLMPMMNPQFAGVRYQAPYTGMEQHVSQIQVHQAQHSHPASSSQASGVASASGQNSEIDSGNTEGETSQQPSPPQPQQQQLQIAYNVPPPAAYFGGGMTIHPRGPGYPPQFVGATQQVPVGPAGAPYRQLYPMQPGGMPPNMHIRGPTGAPYYPGPNGPIPYPPSAFVGHGMMDEDPGFRGRGRGPSGRGRRARGGRGRGPGRGSYSSFSAHGSRQGHQSQVPAGDSPSAPEDGAHPVSVEAGALGNKHTSSE